MFDDNEVTIKTDFFDGKMEDIPTDNSDVFFGAEADNFFTGSEQYGDLFLMDPHDLLGVQEEVIGSENSNAADEISVPIVNETPSPRKNSRRSTAKSKTVNRTDPIPEPIDSSDSDEFTLNIPFYPSEKQEVPTVQQPRVPIQIGPNFPTSRTRIIKISSNSVLNNGRLNVVQNVGVPTQRILTLRRKPEQERQLLPRGKSELNISTIWNNFIHL